MFRSMACLLALFFLKSALAMDLGIRGPVYPVIEKNLLTVIEKRLTEMNQNGEMAKINQAIIKSTKQKITRPEGVMAITSATQNKTWRFDPSWTVTNDISDHKGKIFAKRGQTINPLARVSLNQPLVFINADISKEVNYLQKTLLPDLGQVKVILVNGSVSELANLKQPIYFDQKGLITHRLGITHTPAIVQQDGLYLKILEVGL